MEAGLKQDVPWNIHFKSQAGEMFHGTYRFEARLAGCFMEHIDSKPGWMFHGTYRFEARLGV